MSAHSFRYHDISDLLDTPEEVLFQNHDSGQSVAIANDP